MKQKLLYGLVAAIIIAGGGYLLLNKSNKATAPEVISNQNSDDLPETVPTDSPASINANSPVAIPSKNTLAISTQTAGSEITIDNVFLEKPGFVVIHEIKNDSPSTVIGSSGLLQAGPGQDITFKANLKAGTTYFALLYADNGDKKFTLGTDKLLPLYSQTSNTYSNKTVVQFTVAK